MRALKTGTTFRSADEAVTAIQSNQRVFIHSVSMTPSSLVDAMVRRHEELENVELIHIHTEGEAPYLDPKYSKSFRTNSCFIGSNTRKAVSTGYGDYIPVFLSDVPLLFRRGRLPLDVAMISVSPPDQHGCCSLGSSVDVTVAAIESADLVIAEINPNVPRTHGDGCIHFSEIDIAVESHAPLLELQPHELTDTEKTIGRYIAEIVEDGATLQMGIGGIPDAVLSSLKGHRRLGVHTEMFSDSLIDLVESGVITGEEKKVLPHMVTSSFVMGSSRLNRFINDNPKVILKDAAFTNDTAIIRKNPKVTAINSAIEIDLTGQICADSIGPMQFSGVGGQMDFIRGAALSDGGKPIIAMGSTTRKGVSKIVPFLKEGASVTTTRAHVHYVATEYGITNLFGKNLRQRAKSLIEISHPDHREALDRAAYERFRRM